MQPFVIWIKNTRSEFLTVPVDALSRYLIRDGENGQPLGPEKTMLDGGDMINAGGDCSAGLSRQHLCRQQRKQSGSKLADLSQ